MGFRGCSPPGGDKERSQTGKIARRYHRSGVGDGDMMVGRGVWGKKRGFGILGMVGSSNSGASSYHVRLKEKREVSLIVGGGGSVEGDNNLL